MQQICEQPSFAEYHNQKLEKLFAVYQEVSNIRPAILFHTFLPTGYRQTTLNSVQSDFFESVIYSKVILGMIITLYDDLADHPLHQNPLLLSKLYNLNIGIDYQDEINLTPRDKNIFELARFLFSELTKTLKIFTHFETFKFILQFDIEQIYACNRYSSLIGISPELQNLTESRILGPHNMGIIAAGMIDLMAVKNFFPDELGLCRTVFHLAQRLGRISNLIYTLEREIKEGDMTNEILIAAKEKSISKEKYMEHLCKEFLRKINKIRRQKVQNFNSHLYADGFVKLDGLHASLMGRI